MTYEVDFMLGSVFVGECACQEMVEATGSSSCYFRDVFKLQRTFKRIVLYLYGVYIVILL